MQSCPLPTPSEAEQATSPASPNDFRSIFDEHFDYVWHSLRRLGVPERDVEDVTHDVFLKVHAQLAARDPERQPRPWLFGFCLRVAADYRRLARNHRELLVQAEEPTDPRPLSNEQLEREERIRAALSILDTLELDRRAVFILHVLDGCGMKEVAQALGINVNTAYSRLRLAREDLAQSVHRLRARGTIDETF